MLDKYLLLATLLASVSADLEDHWALLVAGSSGYINYRHQADVFHAWQVMRKNGIPEHQIILYAFDDVVADSRNPFPGQIFNKATLWGIPGEDVYKNVTIDYKGFNVTVKNLNMTLRDNWEATGKVLMGDRNAKVFFYFVDHGGPGFVTMPVKEEKLMA